MFLSIFTEPISIDGFQLLEQILRVVICIIIGGAIGYEREIKSKPAGFFTFILVCVGSCLIAILQQNITANAMVDIIEHPELADSIKVDQGRIIAQVVSGIGFLCGGTIIHTRGTATGITTAAMLWLAAGLGIMVGTGGIYNYIIAIVTVAFILPILISTRRFGAKISGVRKIRRVRIVFNEDFEKELFDVLASMGVIVRKTFLVNKTKSGDTHNKESIIYFTVPKNKLFNDVMEALSSNSEIIEIEEA